MTLKTSQESMLNIFRSGPDFLYMPYVTERCILLFWKRIKNYAIHYS